MLTATLDTFLPRGRETTLIDLLRVMQCAKPQPQPSNSASGWKTIRRLGQKPEKTSGDRVGAVSSRKQQQRNISDTELLTLAFNSEMILLGRLVCL
jgi:hypothetical protein